MIGQTIKSYVVEAMLGKGGMGVVYRARDTRLDRSVALKVLPPELVRDEERRRRFVSEARAASAVNHPAIATVYEIDTEGDTTFIAMEYVNGSTVRDLAQRGELDLGSAIEVGILVGDALASAHAAGIVHRDIKSDNIMVTHDGHPKILDFGLAKLLVASGDAHELETLAMTQAGVVLGTVAYMSPEQARGLPADRRSDIFSLGIVLYEMATGRLPFQGQSALDTMHAIAFDATQPMQALRSDLPYSLQRVVDRCLQKNPDDRYQDARDLVRDLREVRREMESGVSSQRPVLERLRWLPRGLTVPGGFSPRGLVVVAVSSIVLTSLLVTVLRSGGGFPGAMPFLVFGVIVFAHVRGRRRRQTKWFVKKASKLKEVEAVSCANDHLTVVARHPTAKTYLKLNAFLGSANGGMYYGRPLSMTVREDPSTDEIRELVTSPGILFVRDA